MSAESAHQIDDEANEENQAETAATVSRTADIKTAATEQ